VIFVGDPQAREYEASGPSLEQLVKKELHPDGVPTLLGSKSLGMWFRTGSVNTRVTGITMAAPVSARSDARPTPSSKCSAVKGR
jgi:hypothetical protein